MEIAAIIDSKDRMTALDVAYISFGSWTSKSLQQSKKKGNYFYPFKTNSGNIC